MGEQGAEAAQAGESHLEASLGDVMAPLCQQNLRPLYAQAGQELVRGLPVGLPVEAQEMVGGEVRPGRDVREVDGALVGVTHEVPGVGEAPVRLRVHLRARVHRSLRNQRCLLEVQDIRGSGLTAGSLPDPIILYMTSIDWQEAGEFEDIRYHKAEGIAKITINRPEVRNAFRPLTVKEMR